MILYSVNAMSAAYLLISVTVYLDWVLELSAIFRLNLSFEMIFFTSNGSKDAKYKCLD